jgi:hypothetical protein
MPSNVALAIWPIAPGTATARTESKSFSEKPYAKHQQNNAKLRQLVGELLIGDIARRERANNHACQQIARNRRQPKLLRQKAEHEGEANARNDGGNEGRIVRQRPVSSLRARFEGIF